MNKRWLPLLILLLLSLISAPCRPASEEAISLDGFRVVLSPPVVDFPASITFKIKVESDADISQIKLQYRVDRISLIPVTSVAFLEFEPARKVETSWMWDMRETGGLPPGTEIEYWWLIADADGNEIETPLSTLSFDDHHHSWSSLREDKVSLFWYQGSDAFAQDLMDAAQEALERLAKDTGAQLEEKAKIYIYASSSALRGAMIYPQEWTGGVAFTEYGVIALGIRPDPDALQWGKRAIAHELAHLVVHQLTYSYYGVWLPTWLDEGLAIHAEGKDSWDDYERVLANTAAENLISVKSLRSPFPADFEKALLSYAQSYSLVKFLLTQPGGQENMLELLSLFKQGKGYDEALRQVYGFDIEGLDALWQKYVK